MIASKSRASETSGSEKGRCPASQHARERCFALVYRVVARRASTYRDGSSYGVRVCQLQTMRVARLMTVLLVLKCNDIRGERERCETRQAAHRQAQESKGERKWRVRDDGI